MVAAAQPRGRERRVAEADLRAALRRYYTFGDGRVDGLDAAAAQLAALDCRTVGDLWRLQEELT